MSISKYQVFLKTVSCGSFSKAAEAMNFTQSGISHAINSLENELGVKLLSRNRGGVVLTADGRAVLPKIEKLCAAHHSLMQTVEGLKDMDSGLVKIATFSSVSAQWLPGMIKKFQSDYPGIRFELLHGTDTQIVGWVADGRVDVGFVAYPTRPELDADFLYRDPIVGIFADDDPLAELQTLPITMLQELPYIALNEGVEDEITAILDQNHIELDARFVESDDHAVIAMVEQGLGTSLMSMMMLQGFDRRITAVPLDPPGYRELGIACRSRRLLPAAASKFYDYACQWVQEEYAGKEY